MASLHWTLATASTHCGVSKSTLKRRLAADDFPNAIKNSHGMWMVPVTDLIAAGLKPGRPSPPDDLTQVTDLDHEPPDLGHDLGQHGPTPSQAGPHPGSSRITELEHDLAQEQERVRSLTQANTDLRTHIEDLRAAMRMLEPGPSKTTKASTDQPGEAPPPNPSPATEPPAPAPSSHPRRLLARLFSRR